ncbi:MAG: protease inhibitor I42 family protein [Oscillospiraceae bacterium]|nr:protease inhibitor I42 family protein [Oscillospiraceae bacterium]
MNKKLKRLLIGGLAVGGVAAVCAATRRKDTFSIVLKENLTEGYLWNYTMDTDGIIREHSSDYVPFYGGKEDDGGAGQHKWTFAPLAKGETLLHFSYIRPWETEESPAVTATYRVIVDSDRKTTVTLVDSSPNFQEYALSPQ